MDFYLLHKTDLHAFLPYPISQRCFSIEKSESPTYSLLNLLVVSNLDFLISVSDLIRVGDDHSKCEMGYEGEVRQGTPELGEAWSRQRGSNRKLLWPSLLEEMCTLHLEKSLKMRHTS